MTPQQRQRKRHQLRDLDKRLWKGWHVIEHEPDPATRRRHEDFWLKLLGQYERLADELAPPSW